MNPRRKRVEDSDFQWAGCRVRSLKVGFGVISRERGSARQVVGRNRGHRKRNSEFPNPSKANPIQPTKQIPENQSPIVV